MKGYLDNKKESVSFTPHIITPVLSIDRLYTARVATYPNDFYYHGESHDMWEISCILSGAAGFTSGTHVYECLQGDAVITPGGLFHSAWAMNNESIHLMTISFSGEWLNRFVPSGKHTLTNNEKNIVHVLADKIQECLPNGIPHTEHITQENEQIIKNLLEILCLSLNMHRDESRNSPAGTIGDRFSEIARYMKTKVCMPLDMDTICSDCGIGRSALKELFRRYTGLGVIKYYNYLRTRHIVKLLGEGKSMAEISEIMNFSSQNYLSSFFKRETGMTPSEYKTQKLANLPNNRS